MGENNKDEKPKEEYKKEETEEENKEKSYKKEEETEEENKEKKKKKEESEENKGNILIWQIATIVFAILFLLSIFNVFSSTGSTNKITGNAVAYIGENLLPDSEIVVIDSAKENGLILATLNIDGNLAQMYISSDGELLFPTAIPLTEEAMPQIPQDQQPQTEEDWTVFESELPSDMESNILSFDDEQPEVYEGRILEFKNFEPLPNTLMVFYHPNCGWCKEYYSVLLEAQQKYPELTIYTLQSSEELAKKYGITGTPANIINGKYKISGYMPIEDLSEILDKLNNL